MKDKLLIYSGGMDSTVLLHKEKDNIKMAISFYYGQKHCRETYYAEKMCKKLNISHSIIDIKSVGNHLKSNLLLEGGKIPEGHYTDESMKKTVVPFRNGIMLAIAAGIAESNDCKSVLIANHAGDHTIYPDCRPYFISVINNALRYGTSNNINIDAPFTEIDKRKIALIGKDIGIDYSKTWSCYQPKYLIEEIKEFDFNKVSFSLDWLVGFVEGDGCFSHKVEKIEKKGIVNNHYYPKFSITQNDKPILDEIKELFGFGGVYLQHIKWNGLNVYAYEAGGNNNCKKIANLFFNRFSIKKRKLQFLNWINRFNLIEAIHCGTCGTCVERKEALKGFDGTKYEK